MTKEELAAKLDGTEYPIYFDEKEIAEIKEANLVVVMGESDDGCGLGGSIHDEFDCYNGGECLIDKDGIINPWPNEQYEDEAEAEAYFKRKPNARKIEALWCDESDEENEYAWTYKTDIPHAKFDIMDEGEKWCQAFVFSLDDIQ